MSKLVDLVENSVCDLNTTHSYLETYEQLFSPIRDTPLNILQIGVLHGGSMQLWDKYFSNATIYGVDPQPLDVYRVAFFFQNNVKIYSGQPYDPAFIDENFVQKNIKFDIIFDDANPRCYETQSTALDLFRPLLSEGGLLIIEDVSCITDIDRLDTHLTEEELANRNFYDVRNVKGRYDDILYTYTNNTIVSAAPVVSDPNDPEDTEPSV
jgi:hypothetical protein